ncbi:MAG TPA: hypothetical protein VN323_24925 [Candidatus Dormibacteraeota bacterium]|nr:hypothetical protein [Candidatus Dormibacteraeota bacterium]
MLALLAALAGLQLVPAARGEEIPRLTFAQLADSMRANFGLTQGIMVLSGREVEIQGFIIPAGPPDLSFFLLSRVSGTGNYCCELPSGQDETVSVYAAKGLSLRYDPVRVYRIRGVFEAGHQADRSYGVSFFRIRDARVEEAVGARIFKVGETKAPLNP